MKDLEFMKELGVGNFGEVYYGLFRGHTEVAIKMAKRKQRKKFYC